MSIGLIALSVLAFTQSQDLPFVSPVFSDHMVLQRGIRPPIWGWTTPNARVMAEIDGQKVFGKAGPDGKWTIKLPKLEAGGPYTLTVKGEQKVTFKDVLIGDVWVCSGQSNMEQGVGAAKDPEKEKAAANYPHIRLFMTQMVFSTKPEKTVVGQWRVCTPENLFANGWGGFSAVAYFFGRQVHKDVNVPVGLIQTCWGGTPAEAWTSAEALSKMPDFTGAVNAVADLDSKQDENRKHYVDELMKWYAKNDDGTKQSWQKESLDESGWKSIEGRLNFASQGLEKFDGFVWYRTTVEVPQENAGKTAKLKLGAIDDFDTTYVNGQMVGHSEFYNLPRTYEVPAGLLKAGKNVIAVRVLDTEGEGGLTDDPATLILEPQRAEPISLSSGWKIKVSNVYSPTSGRPVLISLDQNTPTALYNAMINPLLPYGIKGAIWYQGESNAWRAYQYRTLLATMIKDWRNRWGVGNFPFLIVQLANYQAALPEPAESDWAELREAQGIAAKTVGNAAVAVIIDAGDAEDIHPKDKQTVGYRLAKAALKVAYGREGNFLSPTYGSMKVKGDDIELSFDNVGSGLIAKGGEAKGFAIAGADRKFVWADAKIVGDKVVVSSPKVRKPVAVRYAWAINPVCNLYNNAGFPVSPFRTDKWPGVTASNH